MNVKKLVIAIVLAFSPVAHNAYAYNEDLFDANSTTPSVNKVEIVSSPNTSAPKSENQNSYNEHLFDDIEIKGKPSSAQMEALKSLSVKKTESKPVASPPPASEEAAFSVIKEEPKNKANTDKKEKTTDKKTTKEKDSKDSTPDNAFQVVKGKIDIPADTTKNKIQLQAIDDRDLPAVLGPVGEVNEWKPVDKNTTPKPKVVKVKPADTTESDPTSDSNVDKFYGIDKNTLNSDSQKAMTKSEKIDSGIPLPTTINLPGMSKDKPAETKKTDIPVKNNKTIVPDNKDKVIHKGGFFNSDQIPKDTSNKNNKDSDEVPITSNKNALSLPVLPITEDELTEPKAIRGNKVDNKLLGNQVYIRIFKQEHSLELWLKEGERFQLANVYDICSYSGGLGPKKTTGDHKSPEGFYKISRNNLQPNSKYYKAINIGFPNAYDRSHGYSGQFLMIHGACVSIGCYAMTDNYIKEIYKFVEAAFRNGQGDIDISIYPFRMTDKNLSRYKANTNYAFWKQLQPGYQYFEATGKPPGVSVNDGKYVINSVSGSANGMYAKN